MKNTEIKTRPDLGRRTRREADDDDDMPVAPAAPADMYDMLSFRHGVGAATTQQWLSMRLLVF